MKYKSVGIFSNETDQEMIVCLELYCEEIYVSPKQSFELFIEDTEDALPVTINFWKNVLQIYPNRGNSEWLIVFNGKKIKPSYPTILNDYI